MFEELIEAGSPPVLGPAQEPVSVADQCTFSHIAVPDQFIGSPPVDNPEYTLIQGLITGAREQIERDLGWAMITQTWRLSLDRFPGFPINVTGISSLLPSVPYYMPFYEPSFYQVDPSNSAIDLMRPPVQAVNSITYVDPNGDLQTFDADDYTLFANKINLKPRTFWPTSQAVPDSVRIEYVTGFGDDPANVPQKLKLAVMFLAGHWYDNRLPVGSAPSIEVERTLKYLLAGYRKFRVPR